MPTSISRTTPPPASYTSLKGASPGVSGEGAVSTGRGRPVLLPGAVPTQSSTKCPGRPLPPSEKRIRSLTQQIKLKGCWLTCECRVSRTLVLIFYGELHPTFGCTEKAHAEGSFAPNCGLQSVTNYCMTGCVARKTTLKSACALMSSSFMLRKPASSWQCLRSSVTRGAFGHPRSASGLWMPRK